MNENLCIRRILANIFMEIFAKFLKVCFFCSIYIDFLVSVFLFILIIPSNEHKFLRSLQSQ